jgi:hypothetical protein
LKLRLPRRSDSIAPGHLERAALDTVRKRSSAALHQRELLAEEARFEMTSESQEIVSGQDLAGGLLQVMLGVVLSRLIVSIENDPAQLRSVVYEFARIKLGSEGERRSTNDLTARRFTLALESAIKCVETVYSRHDALKAPKSLDRSIEGSEIGRSDLMTGPRLPINQPSTETAHADHPPVYMVRAKSVSSIFIPSLHWPGAGPLLRGAVVAIFAVVLCGVFGQFGTFGRQAMVSLPPQRASEPTVEPALARSHFTPSAHFRHRRVVTAESITVPPDDASRYSVGGDHHPPTAGNDEQPQKPPHPSCSTRTYKVPSETGGETSVNVVRCNGQ